MHRKLAGFDGPGRFEQQQSYLERFGPLSPSDRVMTTCRIEDHEGS